MKGQDRTSESAKKSLDGRMRKNDRALVNVGWGVQRCYVRSKLPGINLDVTARRTECRREWGGWVQAHLADERSSQTKRDTEWVERIDVAHLRGKRQKGPVGMH